VRGALAATLVVALAMGPTVPEVRAATTLAANKKRSTRAATPRTTPARAGARREAARERASAEAADQESIAEVLAEAGREGGDPVLFIESAEASLDAAELTRDPSPIEIGRERARIALDILRFLESSDTRWVVVAPEDIGGLVERAEDVLRAGDALEAEIEEERRARAAAEVAAQVEAERKARGPLIAGGVLTGLGAAGVGVAAAGLGLGIARQNEVEDLDMNDPIDAARYDDVDARGKNANLMAYIGLGVGIVGLATGITLLVVGKRRQRERREGDDVAVFHVSPAPGGVLVRGEF
jgi:hypothetical protein